MPRPRAMVRAGYDENPALERAARSSPHARPTPRVNQPSPRDRRKEDPVNNAGQSRALVPSLRRVMPRARAMVRAGYDENTAPERPAPRSPPARPIPAAPARPARPGDRRNEDPGNNAGHSFVRCTTALLGGGLLAACLLTYAYSHGQAALPKVGDYCPRGSTSIHRRHGGCIRQAFAGTASL